MERLRISTVLITDTRYETMKRLILMMPLIASGCANYAFNSNLDKENFDEYFKPGSVRIYEQDELADLNYLYLGTIEGESCQADANQAVPKCR